ncbi:reverse transcriptase family protein [Francisella tularensis]|uniref:reverse transcriptase family protein n=3 Tax=Francisella tularensis TaxID=263 RepID=UPI0008F603AD|nr:reverse transcriptase family protein [Francisella tularensis]APA82882.1 Retron-type RNA-directed DNA polymerase [Francisella tularensis subsp. novicida PA10-7858]
MKNLVYTKNQSPLYKLNSKKKLATLLYTDIANIKKCLANPKRYRNFEKPIANKVRSFEPPVGLNKKIHTRIFQLLTRIDDIPEYLHSGVKGRSYVTNAKQHQLSQYFLKMDIKDFYPSTGKDKVFLFFYEYLQCSPDVANMLALLLTNKNLTNGRHLVQGSCVSQILSFYCNKEMFDEVYKYSKERNITFTLYVDDLSFSSSQNFDAKEIIKQVSKILHRNGYKVKSSKTKYSKIGNITGVIVKNTKLLVRNRTHEKIHRLQNKDSKKAKQIIGQARYIEPTFYTKK